MADRNRVIICEKPNQAADFAAATGATVRKSDKAKGYYETPEGKVTWAEGHLYDIRPPASFVPGADPKEQPYAHWDWDALPLLPETLPLQPSDRGRARLKVIRELLKSASEVWIATDDDAAGECIAHDILTETGWLPRNDAKTYRLRFNRISQQALAEAIRNRVPARELRPRALAESCRREADWLIGMNLSPAASLALVPPGHRQTFPVGRVMSAVLAMVVEREEAIETFRPSDYYEIKLLAETAAGEVALVHAPGDHIEDRRLAEAIAAAARGWTGPLSVTRTRKRQAPPKPFSLSELQKAGVKAGLTLSQVDAAAQSLYDEHSLTTYPRTDGAALDEHMIGVVPQLLEAVAGGFDHLARHIPDSPVIRRGKGGTFSDKALAGKSHHAIVPNWDTPVTPDRLARLDDVERKVLELVHARTLAQFLPDYEYDQTVVVAELPGLTQYQDGAPIVFRAVGNVPAVAGWKVLQGLDEPEDDSDNGDAAASRLPELADGTPAQARDAELLTRTTKPPPYYTEATLIADMIAAAKRIPDPELRAQLKGAGGIGTEATRRSIIAKLYDDNLLETAKGKVRPTFAGRAEIKGLRQYAPEACDPGISAIFEDQAKRITAGKQTRQGFRKLLDAWIRQQVDALRQARPLDIQDFGREAVEKLANAHRPTDAMIAKAEAMARLLGLDLPPEIRDDRGACKAFLDAHAEAYEAAKATAEPSTASLQLAEKVAAAAGIPLPEEARRLASACSAFIDEHKAHLPKLPKSKSAKSGKHGGAKRRGRPTRRKASR